MKIGDIGPIINTFQLYINCIAVDVKELWSFCKLPFLRALV